jgi:hypothetical protein
MRNFFGTGAAILIAACCTGAFAADLFDSSGTVESDLTISSANCVMPVDTEIRLAPSPTSSASAPSIQVMAKTEKPATNGGTACKKNRYYTADLNSVTTSTKFNEWTVGAAIIPFKYYSGGGSDKSVSGNTSAIGYIGLKRHTPGGDLILGAGAGPATISVPGQSSTGSGQTQNSIQATGFSYALMLLGQIGYNGTAQFGIAVGQDRVSDDLNWVNNKRTWVGLQIGAKIF